MFEVQFTDRATGQLVKKHITNHKLARELAQEMASRSGRRVVIRRLPRKRWDIYAIAVCDGQAFHCHRSIDSPTAREVIRLTHPQLDRVALVLWPSGIESSEVIRLCSELAT
jgi:hypothetical protein